MSRVEQGGPSPGGTRPGWIKIRERSEHQTSTMSRVSTANRASLSQTAQNIPGSVLPQNI